MEEIQFVAPTGEFGYRLFSTDMEDDKNVVFHGTAEEHLADILSNGFRIVNDSLPSVSFSNASALALKYASEKRGNPPVQRGVIVAAQFENISVPGIACEGGLVHLYNFDVAPRPIAYCFVPIDYDFR